MQCEFFLFACYAPAYRAHGQADKQYHQEQEVKATLHRIASGCSCLTLSGANNTSFRSLSADGRHEQNDSGMLPACGTGGSCDDSVGLWLPDSFDQNDSGTSRFIILATFWQKGRPVTLNYRLRRTLYPRQRRSEVLF